MKNLVLIDLVNRFKRGDEASFEEIYECFIGLMKHYSYRLDGEDMLQELSMFLVKLLRSVDLSKFSDSDDNGLQRYISVALRNCYIFTAREKSKGNIPTYPFNEIIPISWDSIDERVNLSDAFSYLTFSQRKVMVYRYLYDYSDAKIATILKISRQAVNRLHRRAIESLKRYYKFKK